MSIESYFTSKKQMMVAFFNEFQLSLNQLSIAVQLQIDKQYFDTKNILQNLHPNTVQKQLIQMKSREPELLIKVIDAIYMHFKNQVNAPRRSINNQRQNPMINTPQRTAESSKINRSRVGVASARNQKQDGQNGKNNNIGKEQFSRPSDFKLQQQDSSGKRQNKFQQLNNSIEVSKQLSTEAKHNQKRQINANPVQLLNKIVQKRVNSTSKLGYQQNNSTQKQKFSGSLPKKLHLQNSRSESQLNKKSKILVFSKEGQSGYKNQDFNNISYEKIENPYSKQESQQNQIKIRRNSTERTKINKYQLNSETKQINFENNQFLCQKLDLKIQESALELLNKVKHKRSPSRRKNTQPFVSGNKQNKVSNGYAVMNISKQSIPWGGSRVLTQGRYT